MQQPAHTKGGGYATTYLTIKEEGKIRSKKQTPKKSDTEETVPVAHAVLQEQTVQVKGVGGVEMVVDKVSMLEGFYKVYVSIVTNASILSFVAVEDLYEISFI